MFFHSGPNRSSIVIDGACVLIRTRRHPFCRAANGDCSGSTTGDLYMRRVISLLVSVCALSGCAGEDGRSDMPIRDMWIVEQAVGSASGTPPLGEAIAPVVGGPGDGAPVVTQVGGQSSGPGAVKWHGGQWVMPYAEPPGVTLLNVSCDIWNPTTTAPANVLVEVVSVSYTH